MGGCEELVELKTHSLKWGSHQKEARRWCDSNSHTGRGSSAAHTDKRSSGGGGCGVAVWCFVQGGIGEGHSNCIQVKSFKGGGNGCLNSGARHRCDGGGEEKGCTGLEGADRSWHQRQSQAASGATAALPHDGMVRGARRAGETTPVGRPMEHSNIFELIQLFKWISIVSIEMWPSRAPKFPNKIWMCR
jgi:hypothetical protein